MRTNSRTFRSLPLMSSKRNSKEADLQEAEDEKAYAKEVDAKEASDTDSEDLRDEDGKGTPVKFADDDLKYRPGEPICYIFQVDYTKDFYARIPMRCLTEETLQRLKEWNALEIKDFKYGIDYEKPVKRRKEPEEKFAKRLKAYEVSRRVAKLYFIIKFLGNKCETITCFDFVGHHDVHLVVNKSLDGW